MSAGINKQEDVVIGIQLNLKTVKQQLKEAQSVIKAKMSGVKNDMNKILYNDDGSKRELTQLDEKNLEKYRGKYAKLGTQMQSINSASSAEINKLNKQYTEASSKLKTMQNGAKRAQVQFQGWAMSIMFLGMAMKRLFDTIWKSSSKVFSEVMHSVEGNVTGFDNLTTSLQNLGFTVGEALSPIAEKLVPIIDKLAQWVEAHPKITAGILIVLGVLGTFLMVLGMLVLGVAGLVGMWLVIGPAISAAFTFLAPWLPLIGLIILAVILLVTAWKNNFGGIRDFVKETFAIIWGTIKSVFKDVIGALEGVFMVFKGIFTGDMDMIINGLVKIILHAISAIIKIFMGLGAAIINVFKFAFNLVVDGVFWMIRQVIGAVKIAAEFIDKFTGTDLAKGVDATLTVVDALQDKISTDYITGDDIELGNQAIDTIRDKVEVYLTLDGEEIANTVVQKVNGEIQ